MHKVKIEYAPFKCMLVNDEEQGMLRAGGGGSEQSGYGQSDGDRKGRRRRVECVNERGQLSVVYDAALSTAGGL